MWRLSFIRFHLPFTQAVILMPSTPIFPLEIEETILDLLAEDDNDHSALKTCSLVCQAFLPICRKHIFGSIVLNNHSAVSTSSVYLFAQLLCKRPEIADYIRKLDCTIRVTDLTRPTLQELLRRISRLESLTVWRHHRLIFDWSNNPLRPALLHLLYLPTLTHFRVEGIKNFVVSDLIPCTNLKYLNIGWNTTCAIDRRPDGQPLINFRSLSKISVAVRSRGEDEASQELFSRCQALTDVEIYCE